MASVKYDAVATIRYTQNGEEKKRFQKMGVVFDGAKGMNIKIDNVPVGWDGWIALYEPKPKDGDKPKQAAKTGGLDDMDDDIPL